MLILLAATCLAWIGIISLAFMLFTGTGISAGWIFGGALFTALAVWFVLMLREFQIAPRVEESFDDGSENLDLGLVKQPISLRSGFRRIGLRIFTTRRRFSSEARREESLRESRLRRTARPIRPTFR